MTAETIEQPKEQVSMALKDWTPDTVKQMVGIIAHLSKQRPDHAAHIEREMWGDILRYIAMGHNPDTWKMMAIRALETLNIKFDRPSV